MKKYLGLFAIVVAVGATVLSMLAFAGVAAAASSSYTLFGNANIMMPGNASAHAAQIESSTAVAPGYRLFFAYYFLSD